MRNAPQPPPDSSQLGPAPSVLLVDDTPANLLALEAVLSGLGLDLVRALSGEEALQLLNGRDFAVVLLDVRMPGLSGFETAERMRASMPTRHTPVIFLSATASDEFPVADAYRLGAVDYLVKPFVPDILRAKVAVFVDLFRKSEQVRQLERRERDRTEEALRETERRFARFMAHLPGLAWIKDTSGQYLYVNDAAERAFGIPRAALYGRTDDEVFSRDRAAEFRENDQRALADPAGVQTVEVLIHADGVIRHSLVSKFPIPGPDGQPAMVGGVAIDVTDRLRAEAAQRESEGRLRQLADNLPAGFIYQVVQSGEAHRFTYVSGGVEPLLGVTPAEVVANSNRLYGLIHEDDFPRVRAAEEAALRGNTPFDCRFRACSRVGETRWLHCRSAPRLLPDGGSVWDGVATDITDRVRAEQDLSRKEAELTDFVENAPVGLHWVGPDGTILWANRAELDLLGYAPEEYVGRNIAEFHADRVVIDDILCRLTGGEELHGYEARMKRKDGSVRHVLLSSNVYREGGEFRHTRCFTRDITDRKRAEEEVREQYRRKDEFLAMLAHELRNPLAPIRNSLQILQLRGGDTGVVDRVREMMERQVTHLGRLVDDLLDVSRITTGKVQLHTERLDLTRVARQAVADHRAAFERKKVDLAADGPESPVWVGGDSTRLAQILDNLLINALKFTGPGGEVVVFVSASPGEWALLTVRDTGAGIEPAMLARLFEPFSQADRTLDRSQGGLGLGLAIVKGLAELHGGRVRAESGGLGQGSTFTVTLPTQHEPVALSGQATRAPTSARGLRVLVVEDNRDAADSLRMLLESYGYDVQVAYTGPDGVKAAGMHRPAVVICDIGLPGMDGYQVAAALRGDPATASALLIALTGYGQDEDRRKSQAAGFDEHLTKPADPVALEALLAAAG